MTKPERILWNALRNRQLDGHHFRRQHPIGDFIVDFFCAEARLVIEVDGDSHAGQREYDARRTAWLLAQRITR
jgi:very-short-patch-repair endonuclease